MLSVKIMQVPIKYIVNFECGTPVVFPNTTPKYFFTQSSQIYYFENVSLSLLIAIRETHEWGLHPVASASNFLEAGERISCNQWNKAQDKVRIWTFEKFSN
jgi:hypothetical protein